MKRNLILAAALLALSAPVFAHAQTTSTPDSTPSTASTPAPVATRSPEQVMKMYTKRLSLTDDQQTKMTPIVADRQKQIADLRGNASLQGRDKLKKLKSITQSADSQINAILTPDQQKKYADFEAEQKEKMQERRKDKAQS